MKTKRMRHEDNVWRSLFSSSFMDSLCCVRNKLMYVLSWWTVSVLTQVFFGIYFPHCFATWEINTKITLLWALKQFITRVDTLFTIWLYHQYAILLSKRPLETSFNKIMTKTFALNETHSCSCSWVFIHNCSDVIFWNFTSHSGRENLVNTCSMVADAQAPCIARSSAAMVLTILHDRQIPEGAFKPPVLSQANFLTCLGYTTSKYENLSTNCYKAVCIL